MRDRVRATSHTCRVKRGHPLSARAGRSRRPAPAAALPQEHEYMETWQLVLVPSGCVVILAGILSVRIGAQAVVAPEAQKELALAGPNSSSDQGLANAT